MRKGESAPATPRPDYPAPLVTEGPPSLPTIPVHEIVPVVNPVSRSAYGEEWRQQYYKSLTKPRGFTAPTYYAVREAVEKQDPRIAIQERFGFHFPQDANHMTIPAFSEALSGYRELMAEHKASGRRKKEKFLEPGRLFRLPPTAEALKVSERTGILPKLEYRTMGFDEEPGADWTFVDVSDNPDLFFFLFSHGFFPANNDYRTSHDWQGHFGSFAANPEYMEALMDFLSPASGDRKLSNKDLYARGFYIVEALALVPKAKREELVSLLSKPFRETPDNLQHLEKQITVAKVIDFLERQDQEGLLYEAFRLFDKLPKLVVPYGGSATEIGLTYHDSEFAESLGLMTEELLRATRLYKRELRENSERTPELRKKFFEAYARIQVTLNESTALTAEEFIQEASRPNNSPSPRLLRFFSSSGISTAYNDIGGRSHTYLGPFAESLKSTPTANK